MGARGPQTSCDDALTAKIEASVREIGFLATAAELHGINRRTAYLWMEKGEKGEEPYAKFALRVKTAQALHSQEQLKSLSDPRWKLERLDREQFAPPKTEVEMSGKLTVDFASMSDAELEKYIDEGKPSCG